MNKTGGSHEDIEARIQRTRVAFAKIKPISRSRIYRLET